VRNSLADNSEKLNLSFEARVNIDIAAGASCIFIITITTKTGKARRDLTVDYKRYVLGSFKALSMIQ
jgi:hypothetical protein